MARFQFDSRRPARAHVHAAVSRRTLRALKLQDDDDAIAQGPGWFDSSWELEHGLKVSEGLPGDAGLYEWLDVALRA